MGVWQHKFTERLLNIPELPTHDDRFPTSKDHKASFCRQAIALPTALVNVGYVTPHTPYFGMHLASGALANQVESVQQNVL